MRSPALRLLVALLALAAPATLPAVAPAARARASLTDIELDVMCVSCREPLAVAQSPQAMAERNFVRTLIAQGLTKSQIEDQLVAQYGPAVLGRPPAHGFNLTVYVLPPALVLLGAVALAVALPRWRRGTRSRTPSATPAPLPEADAARLERELGGFSG